MSKYGLLNDAPAAVPMTRGAAVRAVQNAFIAFSVVGVAALTITMGVVFTTSVSPVFDSVRINGILQLASGNLTLDRVVTRNATVENLFYDNNFRRNHTLTTSAHAAATKAIQGVVLDDVLDFPSNVVNYTRTEQEEYRKYFLGGLTGLLGEPVGYKVALNNASPSTPALGYTAPQFGQILKGMMIQNTSAVVRLDYQPVSYVECEIFLRVSNVAINDATTFTDIMNNVDAVFPGIEFPDVFLASLVKTAASPAGGKNLLTALNAAARLFVMGDPIPVTGTRTIPDWVSFLGAAQNVTQHIHRPTGNTTTNADATVPLNGVNFLLDYIRTYGYRMKPGDIIASGTVVGVRQMFPTDTGVTCVYPLLDPGNPALVLQTLVHYTQGTGIAQRQ